MHRLSINTYSSTQTGITVHASYALRFDLTRILPQSDRTAGTETTEPVLSPSHSHPSRAYTSYGGDVTEICVENLPPVLGDVESSLRSDRDRGRARRAG